jgi:O-antigen ligase
MELKQVMHEPAIKRSGVFYSGPLIVLVAVFATVIVLCAPSKFIATFALLPVMVLLYIGAPHFAKIVFPMIMITFPITLQYAGRDALTTGTLVIFVTLAWALTKHRISATVANDKFLFTLLLLLICIAFIGMATKTPGEYWGTVSRHYLNFVSSIAVFILIIHSQYIHGTANSKRDYIEKIISALLWITVINVLLSLFILNFPWVEKYFAVFLRRTHEHLSGYIIDGVYTRATTVFTSGEGFGELLILLFPFALYKIFTSPKKIYLFVIIVLLLGILITGTRSAFLIIVFQSALFVYVLVPRTYNTKKFVFTAGFIFISILMLPVFLKYAPILMDRVQETFTLVQKDADISRIANRQVVWTMAYDVTMKTISLFGHGPIQASGLDFPVRNFHNLYLSLLFQFGIIGTIIFLLFFLVLAKRLFKTAKKMKSREDTIYLVAAACLLSFFCFLINEIKFEFNRSDSYQQFTWIFFAVFYLTGTLRQNHKNEKTHHN